VSAPVYDAIVLRGDLNGLTAAAYLAKGGARVLVLDERGATGGEAVTVEFFPGFRVDACLHDVGWIPPGLMRDLELGRHGIEILRPDPAVLAPLPGRGRLLFWRDSMKTAAALREHCPADAARWSEFIGQMQRLSGFLCSLYDGAPPRPTVTGLRDLLALVRVGWRARRLGRSDMVELLRVLPMAVADLLDDWFTSDALKGVLGAAGVSGIFQGPRSGGSAFVLLHHLVGAEPGAFGPRGLVRGGVGRLAGALADAARRFGAEWRGGARAERLVLREGSVRGVVLEGGEEIAARCVASAMDVRRTFEDLLDPAELDPELLAAVRHVRFRGAWAKVHLALGELPRFSGGAASDEADLRGLIVVAPSLDYLERAYDDAKHGALSRRPWLQATIPSLHDGGSSPPGRHVMSVQVQYAPYNLKESSWDDAARARLGDAVVAVLGEWAPNLPGAVLHRQVLAPVDLEARFGLLEGDLHHGELALDQVLFMRPVPACAGYRTPVRGLYLCGSGTHPGGGIVGAAGRNASRVILADLEGGRR
jgi:phytoene dehydrogenase-like protein